MISAHVDEEGTMKFTITFEDESDVEWSIDSLTSASWQLSDYDGNIIGDMTFDNESILEIPVVLTCKDLAIGSNGPYRIFAVKIIYNSSDGIGLCNKQEYRFKINNLINFPE